MLRHWHTAGRAPSLRPGPRATSGLSDSALHGSTVTVTVTRSGWQAAGGPGRRPDCGSASRLRLELSLSVTTVTVSEARALPVASRWAAQDRAD